MLKIGAGRLGTNSSSDNPDPIIEVKHLGNVVMGAFVLGLGLIIGSNAFRKSLAGVVATAFSGSGGGIQVVVALFTNWSLPIVALGFVYANLIPMLPWMMWTAAVAGLLIYQIEAVYAIPLSWANHAHPEGHDLVGKGGSAYPILLSLTLRPALMVLGFTLGRGLTLVMAWFINQTFAGAVEAMNVGGLNLSSLFGYIAVYGISMTVLIYKGYALSYEFPTGVMHWMGVSSHHADLGEKEAHQQTLLVAGRMGGHVVPNLANLTQPSDDTPPAKEGASNTQTPGGDDPQDHANKEVGQSEKKAGGSGNTNEVT